ncbi:hypothetical protein [Saccharothrix sp. Mg75]|uniref:hypothetical protein n=1 Tax=Saccharothrix sp. Mg75 TaxID=3445357 RepID=UPI003EEFDFCC
MTVPVPGDDLDDVAVRLRERLPTSSGPPPPGLLWKARQRYDRCRRRRHRTRLLVAVGVTAVLAAAGVSLPRLVGGHGAEPGAPPFAVDGPWRPWDGPTGDGGAFTLGRCAPPRGSADWARQAPSGGWAQNGCDGLYTVVVHTGGGTRAGADWTFAVPTVRAAALCAVRIYIPDSGDARSTVRYDLYPYTASWGARPSTWSFELRQGLFRGRWVEYDAALPLADGTGQVVLRAGPSGTSSSRVVADAAQLRCR